jgi:hypothetical protein
MHKEMFGMLNFGFVAKEICHDIKAGIVTEEQGTEALFKLLLTFCGAKEKESKRKYSN